MKRVSPPLDRCVRRGRSPRAPRPPFPTGRAGRPHPPRGEKYPVRPDACRIDENPTPSSRVSRRFARRRMTEARSTAPMPWTSDQPRAVCEASCRCRPRLQPPGGAPQRPQAACGTATGHAPQDRSTTRDNLRHCTTVRAEGSADGARNPRLESPSLLESGMKPRRGFFRDRVRPKPRRRRRPVDRTQDGPRRKLRRGPRWIVRRRRLLPRITSIRTVAAGAAPPESVVSPAKALAVTPTRTYAAPPPSDSVNTLATPLAGLRTASS